MLSIKPTSPNGIITSEDSSSNKVKSIPRFNIAPATPPISHAWATFPEKLVSDKVTFPRMLAMAPATPPYFFSLGQVTSEGGVGYG